MARKARTPRKAATYRGARRNLARKLLREARARGKAFLAHTGAPAESVIRPTWPRMWAHAQKTVAEEVRPQVEAAAVEKAAAAVADCPAKARKAVCRAPEPAAAADPPPRKTKDTPREKAAGAQGRRRSQGAEKGRRPESREAAGRATQARRQAKGGLRMPTALRRTGELRTAAELAALAGAQVMPRALKVPVKTGVFFRERKTIPPKWRFYEGAEPQ